MGVNVNPNSRQSGGQSLSIIWIIAGALGIIFGGLLIGTLAPLVLPVQASAESQQVDSLFRFMLVIGGAIFLLVIGALVYSIIAYRAKPGDRSDGPPIHGNSTLEIVWTLIPAVIVIILTIYSFQVWTSIRTVRADNQDVGVVAQRYAWSFNYAITPETLPPDVSIDMLEEPVRTALTSEGGLRFSNQQLHTWVGQQVEAKIRSEDVNHAFWIPAMRIKQDALPAVRRRSPSRPSRRAPTASSAPNSAARATAIWPGRPSCSAGARSSCAARGWSSTPMSRRTWRSSTMWRR
ncbi:MAG: cytochrome c oxidase subunit II [Chloroflexi bacterium]|nr:cytochrome c oxidase subunit II [Chloroflexota bacterium]